jgi:mannose-6-phosphate isomerase-like protein (cupin superfamily)/NAD-dependent SIR2 family protein deacetylase
LRIFAVENNMENNIKDGKLDLLIDAINLKKNYGGPCILLGAGCSVMSGCPSTKTLIEDLIKNDNLDLDPNEATLRNVEKKLGKSVFNANIKKYFSVSLPSTGFQFLAELIKKGYFELILTTNFDSCLEKTLAKTLDYDEFRVYIRGDVSDVKINELIDFPTPRTKIIKLHGDYLSENVCVALDDIWELEDPLKRTLSDKIKKRGIIIIGCSMHDSSMLRILTKDFKQDYWYVDVGQPDDITKSHLEHTLIKEEQRITCGFDEFFTLLMKGLGKIATSRSKEIFDNNSNKEEIANSCKFQEVDTDKLFGDLYKLYHKIAKSGIENLVFIHDPKAPGGSGLLELIKEKHQDLLKGKNIYKLHIKGRGEEERKVTNLEQVENSNDAPKRYLLIDSVSFSGRTLEMCRDYLINEKKGQFITVGAAVIYSGRPQEKKLEDKKYCFKKEEFLRVESINTHQILFPWGLTQATESIFAEVPKPNSIDEYIPHKYFSFLPRPWGNIFSMMENKQITVKILHLNPGEMTSRHKHFCRNEIFFVLDERVILQVWDKPILLYKGASFRVPAGTVHRFIGLDEPCRLLEIAQNYHDQIEDIERLEDKYGREAEKGDV